MESTRRHWSIALLLATATIFVAGPVARSQQKQERAFRGSDPDYGSSVEHRRPREAGRLALAVDLPAAAAEHLVFHDPLTTGTTVGTRDNGQGVFVPGGWKVTSPSDNIRYTSPLPIEEGAVEFDVTGLSFDDTRPQNHRGQLMSMYDASFGDPRHRYSPDLRLNPFKFVLHRYGRDEEAYFANFLKLIMNTDGVNQFEDYSGIGPYPWDENTNYHMRLEWKDGLIRFYINGQDTDPWPFVYRSVYRPQVHDIRIGTNTRNNAILDAVYSNVRVYDFGTAPSAPLINNPASGSIVDSLTPHIDWTGERHTHYQVRVNASSNPEVDIIWDSGEVASPLHYAESETLSNDADYFAHVRLRNVRGWGPWSDPTPFATGIAQVPRVKRYGQYEVVLRTTNPRSSPYTDVALSATFSGPTQTITVRGFWDGGELYKIRMLPTQAGTWHWSTTSNDPELHGRGGSLECVESSEKGYVRISRERPHSFEWAADGGPFFLMGDTLWHMYYNLRFSDGSFQSVIDDRARQHFNYAHGVVHDALANEGGSIYSRQNPDLEIFDVDTLNPAYFHWLDEKIDYMNAKGMIAGLFFSWGDGHYQEYQRSDQYERFMRYMVARYGSKNVVWIIVGEFEEGGEPLDRWRDYMRTVQESDPYGHPISLHTTSTTNAFGNDPQLSFIGQQLFGSPEELRQRVADSRRFGKPVVNLEYGYEGDPRHHGNNQPPDDVRRDHYALALAGGHGVYGNNTPGYSTYHRVGDFRLSSTDTPGAQYLSILYEFFTGLHFERLSPAQHLVSSGIAAAWANVDYVVQLPSGGGVSVDLLGARGTLAADWFDPRTGTRTSAGTTSGGAVRSFSAPDGQDWILHLRNYPLGDAGSVSVDLGSPDVESGMAQVAVGDGNTTPVDIGGRSARRNLDPASDSYFYFEVSDGFAFEGDRPEKHITVEYWDGGSGALALQYDASGSVYRNGGTIALAGTNTWKSHTFRVSDAYFGNRQNGGADFRIFGGTGNTFYLDVVTVAHRLPGPPAPATSPQPADHATGVSVNVQLSWTAGAGATSHDVYFGTSNPPPARGTQTGASYDPGALSPATTYFWRVDEVNPNGTTSGPLWRFTTQGRPGAASQPVPGSGATGVATATELRFTPGADAALHELHFGTTQPPPHRASLTEASFRPGSLEPRTTYFWRVDEVNGAGTTEGSLWSFTTADAPSKPTLDVKAAGALTVDGNPGDWRLSEFTRMVRAGELASGDIARVGYDGGTLYTAGYATHLSLPASAADHTASVYSRHSTTHLYFLIRFEDDDVQTPFAADMNWANDCAEVYLDPSGNGGGTPMIGSTSDVQLVIDAKNQKNVYMATSAYRAMVLSGVASAVSRDDSGFWIEIAIDKGVLSPAIPASGSFGADFNFRDNDENNRPDKSTVYTWSDPERSANFPSKIPDRWGRAVLADVPAQATFEILAGLAPAIDGNPDDWNLSSYSRKVRGGETTTGDIALIGFDTDGVLYKAGYATTLSLPENASDHTATVYGRYDASYLYFLVRLADQDIRTPFGADANWANDAVELYIDPGSEGGSSPIEDSTSYVQLVIDAANQRNVYMTTTAYRQQVLDGVASAVSRDGTGWWLEVRIDQAALNPDLPGSGAFGLDFNFRDNDANNRPDATTVYTWSDVEQSGSFPSKIPNRWGRARLLP
ncbi:MAG TPA: DUF4038 domain-containing protein [Vicinamibacteria bacterium]|nr:DUF4038 domain-containing protein [Vicinamibacteria bacterium]